MVLIVQLGIWCLHPPNHHFPEWCRDAPGGLHPEGTGLGWRALGQHEGAHPATFTARLCCLVPELLRWGIWPVLSSSHGACSPLSGTTWKLRVFGLISQAEQVTVSETPMCDSVGFTTQDMEAFKQLVETVLADAGMGIKGIYGTGRCFIQSLTWSDSSGLCKCWNAPAGPWASCLAESSAEQELR